MYLRHGGRPIILKLGMKIQMRIKDISINLRERESAMNL